MCYQFINSSGHRTEKSCASNSTNGMILINILGRKRVQLFPRCFHSQISEPLDVVARRSDGSVRVVVQGDRLNPAGAAVVGGNAVLVRTPTLLEAVDIAYKAHWLFGTDYAPDSKAAWEFLQQNVYGMQSPITSKEVMLNTSMYKL